METILASLITGAVTLVICLINNHAQAEKTRALLDYRLSELEKKQDKHNNVIERTFRLEADVQSMKEHEHEIMEKLLGGNAV